MMTLERIDGTWPDDLVEAVAVKIADCDGLDYNEVCGVVANPDEGYCDSGSCVAAYFEEHDVDYARSYYRSHARAALDAIEAFHRITDPDMPGSFTGDIWFGHPVKRTLGTHKWNGKQWVELPDEIEILMELLALKQARLREVLPLIEQLKEYLTDNLDAHEHSDGRDLMDAIEAWEGK